MVTQKQWPVSVEERVPILIFLENGQASNKIKLDPRKAEFKEVKLQQHPVSLQEMVHGKTRGTPSSGSGRGGRVPPGGW